MESDFQSVYGLDLRAVLWGDAAVGCRRVLTLVECLPPTAVTLLARAGTAEAASDDGPKSVRDAVRGFFGGGDA